MSKLHHTIAKLAILGVCTFHLGIHFSFGCATFFGYATFWGYALSIWVYTFYLGMHFLFGYALFIWVCTFYLGMHFSFGCALFDRHMRMHLYAPRASRDSLMNM